MLALLTERWKSAARKQQKNGKERSHLIPKVKVIKAKVLVTLSVDQPPASEWDAQRVNHETGLTLEQLDLVEDLCREELVEIPARSNRSRKLSPRNLLLLTLKWLRRYP